MEPGIPILTAKGLEALKTDLRDLTPLCRNILVHVDGQKSLKDILTMLRGLKGLDESIQTLLAGGYIDIALECRDLVKALVREMLGPKAPTLVKKIDDLHAKYGKSCWEHLDEVDKTARMFYGEVIANKLKFEISKILQETGE